jgi:FkbM family methyltransferase
MKIVEFTTFGRTFKAVDPTSIGFRHTIAEFEDHEPVLQRWCDGIQPGDVVIDAGAQFGSYTLPALAAGALVIAYEPSDDGFEILSLNLQENVHNAIAWEPPSGADTRRFWRGTSIETPCAILRKACLWDDTPYPAELGRQVFGQHYPSVGEPKTVRLDDDLRQLGVKRVDHIKLDVEGVELGVLYGAERTLYDHRPRLIVEDHEGVSQDPNDEVSRYPERIESGKRMRELLQGLGYQIEIVPWDVSRSYWVAEHPRSKR